MTIWCTCQSIGNIFGQQVGSIFIVYMKQPWHNAILFASVYLFICALSVFFLLVPFPREEDHIQEEEKKDIIARKEFLNFQNLSEEEKEDYTKTLMQYQPKMIESEKKRSLTEKVEEVKLKD